MKIVLTSDLHGFLPNDLPKSDILIIAGDVCPVWDHSIQIQKMWLETDFSEWLRLQRRRTRYIVGIGGNHDFALQRFPWLAYELPWFYLKDEALDLNGIKFWGTPWVPNLTNWAFYKDDHGLCEQLASCPVDTDILISHGPPRGYLDFTAPRFGSMAVGFPGLNDTLNRVQPGMMVCGHIHEGYGWDLHESGTYIFNAAHVDEGYKPVNRHWTVTWEKDMAQPRTPKRKSGQRHV